MDYDFDGVIRACLGLAAAIVLGIAAAAFCVGRASADHNIYLPIVPNTPLIQQLVRAQEYTFCLDSRSANYPAFATQLRDVNAQYAERVGIRAREVGFSDLGCQVKHTMPDSFGCGSGAAACIHYANWPVIIEYNYRLGYVDWRTAHGHELGHGLLGLHEQYSDSAGGIGCTGKQWTVMDCGSGVRYPQDWDVNNGCGIIRTSWCGNPPPAPEWCCQQDYDSDGNADDGYYHIPSDTWYWDVHCRFRWTDEEPTWAKDKGCP